MQTKLSPFLSRSVLKQYGLQASASKPLSKAQKRGTISPEGISELLPVTLQDQKGLNKAISKVAELLDALKISILVERPQKAYQKNGHSQTKTAGPPPEKVKVNGSTSNGDTVPELVLNGENDGGQSSIYYRQVSQYPLLSHEEVVHLSRRVCTRKDTRARNKLVVHNLRLVLKIARWYLNRGLDYDDLVQEGNVGLMTAAERYDGRKGFQFSTYSHWWIRQSITRAIANCCSTIRVPVHSQEAGQKILKISADLFQQLGREPSVEEIAARAKVAANVVTKVLARFRIPTVSLDEIINDGEANTETTLANYIPDTKFIKPSRALEAKEELDEAILDMRFFFALLAELDWPERNKEAFRMYYGFGEDRRQDHVLESIGEVMGVTRERIRQIIVQTWTRLLNVDAVFDEASFLAELERIHSLEDIVGMEAVLEVTPADKERARQVIEKTKMVATLPPEELTAIGLLEREPQIPCPKGEQIIKAVERCSGVSEKLIVGRGRGRKVALARQIAMYLVREDLEWSLAKVGARFGRDYTTVLSNCNKIRILMDKDSPAGKMIEQIRADYRGEIAKTAPSQPVNEKVGSELEKLAADLAIGLGATLVTKNGS